MSGLSVRQYNGLLRPIDPKRVSKDPKGHAHVEAWDVRRHLIRLFGFGGWDFTVVTCECVSEVIHQPQEANGKPRYSIVYRVVGRLTIRTEDGAILCVYEDGATGDATNQPSLGDAHDMALKTAMSQALKRCAANLGDQFGLSLYNDGKTEAVVVGSYVAPSPSLVSRDPGGEETEPPAEAPVPASTEPKAGSLTPRTRGSIFALFTAIGIESDEDRHAFADQTLKRTGVSFKALTEEDGLVLEKALVGRKKALTKAAS